MHPDVKQALHIFDQYDGQYQTNPTTDLHSCVDVCLLWLLANFGCKHVHLCEILSFKWDVGPFDKGNSTKICLPCLSMLGMFASQ